MIVEILRDEGLNVIGAATGDEALSLLGKQTISMCS